MARTTKTDEKPAAAAAEDEAPEDPSSLYADQISFSGNQTVIAFRGQKFKIPTSRADWPTKAFQAFQRQRHADGLELILGPAQWERFNRVAPTISDFWEFLPIFAHATGFLKADG